MMTLKDWREENGLSAQKLGEELGLDEKSAAGTLWRWETGRSRPDADVIAKIEEVTNGQVTAHDMHLVRLSHLQSREEQALAS